MNGAEITAILAQGDYFSQCGDIQSAISCYQQCLRSNKKLLAAHIGLYNCTLKVSKIDEALRSFTEILEIEPKSFADDAITSACELASAVYDSEEKIRFFDRLLQIRPNSTQVIRALADLHRSTGNFSLALELYERLFELEPQLRERDTNRGIYESLHYRANQIEFLLEEFKYEVEGTDCRLKCLPIEERESIKRALENAKNSRFDLAIEQLNQILTTYSRSSLGYYYLGVVYDYLRRISQREDLRGIAIGYLAGGLKCDPKNPRLWYQTGRILLELAPQIPNNLAIVPPPEECLRKAITLDPNFEEAHFELGQLLCILGRYSEAADSFTRYNELFSRRISTHPLGKIGVRFIPRECVTMIGHTSAFLDAIIKSQKLGYIPECKWVLLAPEWLTANPFYVKCWSKYFEIVTDPQESKKLFSLQRALSHRTPLVTKEGGRTSLPRLMAPYVEKAWDEKQGNPLLQLDDETIERGWRVFSEMGIPRGTKFIALHVRDRSYKGEGEQTTFHKVRNSSIEDYTLGIQEIIRCGWAVVRLGEAGNRPGPELPGLFEYGRSRFKSDWMDIFICAQCDFFVGSGAGLISVPSSFGKPHVSANFQTTHMQYPRHDLFIPKLLWSKKEARHLTFNELAKPPLAQQDIAYWFEAYDIEYRPNSPEEILEVIREMIERTNGTAHYSAEDEKLQERYRSLWQGDFGVTICRIGRDFLRRHTDLIT